MELKVEGAERFVLVYFHLPFMAINGSTNISDWEHEDLTDLAIIFGI